MTTTTMKRSHHGLGQCKSNKSTSRHAQRIKGEAMEINKHGSKHQEPRLGAYTPSPAWDAILLGLQPNDWGHGPDRLGRFVQ